VYGFSSPNAIYMYICKASKETFYFDSILFFIFVLNLKRTHAYCMHVMLIIYTSILHSHQIVIGGMLKRNSFEVTKLHTVYVRYEVMFGKGEQLCREEGIKCD